MTSFSALTSTIIPYSSTNNVTFTCDIIGSDMYTPLWVLSGLQIPRSDINNGFIIEYSSNELSSNLTITMQGRMSIDLEVISIQCDADHMSLFRLVKGQQIIYIIQFGKNHTNTHV